MSTKQLIHGVFNTTENVLKATLERLSGKGFAIDQFTWIGPETPPDFTTDPEVVVVLDVTLETLQETFEFAWEWAKDGQEDSWRWDGLESTPDKLRLLQGSPDFQPFTLRWRRIKLNTNVGKKPVDVRSSEASSGLALLFVAAQHPARVKATDYEKRFGWYMPGLECTAPDDESWQGVPYVRFDQDDHQVLLIAGWYDNSNDNLAVPIFVD